MTSGSPADEVDSLSPVYLLHRSRRDQSLDRDDREYYRLLIWIDSDDPDFLGTVEEVVYHLHPDFREPTRTVSNPAGGFALKTAAWGQFLISATVKVAGSDQDIRIERYLNF